MADGVEVKYRVDDMQVVFLVSMSLLIDIVQALLNLFFVGIIINRIITPFAWLLFLTWFYFLGIKFTKGGGKNMGTSLISMVIEMIPYLDLLPGWTVATILLIAASRREDKGKKPAQKKGELKGKKDEKNKDQKNQKNKPSIAEQKAAVGSEIKTAENNSRLDKAQKELEAPQTTGAKTAEQKTAEASPEKPKEQPKIADQDKGVRATLSKEDELLKLYGRGPKLSKETKQGQTDQEELAEFEDLPLKKEGVGAPMLEEAEGGQDKQEFSMGDIYREPIEIPKKHAPDSKKDKQKDDDLELAA